MTKYVAIYIGTAEARENSDWANMSEAERKEKEQEGMEAWDRWMEVME